MKRLLLGPRAVVEGLRAGAQKIAVVYATAEAARGSAEAHRLAQQAKVRFELRSREELDAMSGAQRHQGLLAITGEYSYLSLEALRAGAGEKPLFVALDQVTDPQNLGAIVRSAVALGADGVISLKDRAAPVTSAVVRASAGATELARIARVTNLARTLAELREGGLEIVGLDAEGSLELSALGSAPAGRVLVVGSEGQGLRRLVREQCHVLARIALAGRLHSLNAAVAAGIALYECTRAR